MYATSRSFSFGDSIPCKVPSTTEQFSPAFGESHLMASCRPPRSPNTFSHDAVLYVLGGDEERNEDRRLCVDI